MRYIVPDDLVELVTAIANRIHADYRLEVTVKTQDSRLAGMVTTLGAIEICAETTKPMSAPTVTQGVTAPISVDNVKMCEICHERPVRDKRSKTCGNEGCAKEYKTRYMREYLKRAKEKKSSGETGSGEGPEETSPLSIGSQISTVAASGGMNPVTDAEAAVLQE